MKTQLELLKQANDILRSVNSIIDRQGKETNWEAISKVVKMALADQHELLQVNNCAIPDVRFQLPSDEQLIDTAILFNDGKLESEKLSDMVGMCQFVIDRLYENGDIMKPSSKEGN